jgi:hypothetical protein
MKLIYLFLLGLVVFVLFGKKAAAVNTPPVFKPLGENNDRYNEQEIKLKSAEIETPINPIYSLPPQTIVTNAATGLNTTVADFHQAKINELVAAGMILLHGNPELIEEIKRGAQVSKNPYHVEVYQKAQEWIDNGRIKTPPYLADVGKVSHKANISQLMQYAICEIILDGVLYTRLIKAAGNAFQTYYAHIFTMAEGWLNDGTIQKPPYLN